MGGRGDEDEERRGNGYHDGAHIKFILALNSREALGIWKAIILHK